MPRSAVPKVFKNEPKLVHITMKLALLVVLVVLSMSHSGLSARILGFFPFPGKSHYIFYSSILKTLVARGHQVVEFSPYPPSKPISNYSHVPVHTAFEEMTKTWSYEEFSKMASGHQTIAGFVIMWFMMHSFCEDVFRHSNVQQLLESNERFDLVITESSFAQESMVVLGHKFGAPTITVQGFGTWSALNMDAGNSLSIASIPDRTSFAITDQMTLMQRVLNLFSSSLTLAAYYLFHLPRQDRLIRQYYSQDAPYLADMTRNISLYFVGSHPAIEYTQPVTPNIVNIAGINISPERIPLTQDLQKFMDESENGVIYFSLGTVVPAHLLPKETLNIFVNVFSKLKQRVLWKIELDSLPDLSPNVKLVKWVPQPGVLAHPNCVLFMTHGGLFSQNEALYAGVPTVGIPFFGDQPFNIKLSEHRGFGVKLDFSTLSEETVAAALHTVLSDPKYRKNAQRMSRIFRDRPMSPADTVVFWTEYVLRHAGAHHLRPASTQLSWYQLYLLDVLAAILIPPLIVIAILFLGIRKFLSKKDKKKLVSKSKKER